MTGASRGLGLAVARRLASTGVRVAVSARTVDSDDPLIGSLREAVATIEADGGYAVGVRGDLARREDIDNLVDEVQDRLGPIDVLVNNAAVTYFGPMTDFSERRFDLMVDVQVKAPMLLTQRVAPLMADRGRGWILNVTSRSAIHPEGPPYRDFYKKWGATGYGMCKAALERMTTGMAAELSDHGVVVNALAPWRIVPTEGAMVTGAVPQGSDKLEPAEWFAEAALAMCCADVSTLTGRIAYSEPLLRELGITPRSLDGQSDGLPMPAALTKPVA